MSDSLDPYYLWLGIPPEEQPPNHYRLLVIQRFENNRDVISHAAEQRISHVRSMQMGPRSSETQKILNELAAARICLMTPDQKTAYDARLQAEEKTSAGSAPRITEPPPAAPPEYAPQREAAKQTGHAFLTPAAISVVIASAIVLAVLLSRGGVFSLSPDPNIVGEQPSVDTVTSDSSATDDALASQLAVQVTNDQVVTQPAVDGRANERPESKTTGEQHVEAVAGPDASVVTGETTETPKMEGSISRPPALPAVPEQRFAIQLDGVSASIELLDTAGLIHPQRPFTIEFWARFANDDLARSVIGDRVGLEKKFDAAGWLLHLPASWDSRSDSRSPRPVSRRLQLLTQSTQEGHGRPIRADWCHVAFTSDGRALRVYVDGMIHLTEHGRHNTWRDSDSNLVIGRNDPPPYQETDGFAGAIRALRISSTCKYRSYSFVPPQTFRREAGDEVLLDFSTGSGELLTDLSGHNRDGKIRSGKWISAAASASATGKSSPDASLVTDSSKTTEPPTSPEASSDDELAKPKSKRALPDAVAEKAARDQIRINFAPEFATAKQPVEFFALAEKLRLEARFMEDPDTRYVLFDEARQAALSSHGFEMAMEIIDQMDAEYAIDALLLKVTSLDTGAQAVRITSSRRLITVAALAVVDQCLEARRAELSLKAGELALDVAMRGRLRELLPAVRERHALAVQLHKQWQIAQAAAETLESDPDHPDANLALGKVQCFALDDWPSGLKHLAAGSDDLLRNASELELAEPESANDRLSVANAWWMAAPSTTNDDERLAMLRRARDWYKQALPELKGLDKAIAERRLEEIDELSAATPAPYKAATSASNIAPTPRVLNVEARIDSKLGTAAVGVVLRPGGPDEFAKSFEDRGYRRVDSAIITVTEPVTEPTVFTGNIVKLKADIHGDVAIMGKIVDVEGTVEGNIEFSGVSLTIESGAVVKGNIHANPATSIVVNGEVQGRITGSYRSLRRK